MGSVINFVPTGTKIGNNPKPWFSDAFETIGFKQVMLQLVVDNAMGPQNSFMDVKWEISNDLKNWVQYPSGGVMFTTVTIGPAGPTSANQAILETNIAAYMRVMVDTWGFGGADCAFQLSVTGVARN